MARQDAQITADKHAKTATANLSCIALVHTWSERALEINIRYPIYLAATIVAPLPADERVPANATPPAAYDGGIVKSLYQLTKSS
jgi:hypothetical protein